MNQAYFVRQHLGVCGLFAFPGREEFAGLHIDAHLQLVPGFPEWVDEYCEVYRLFFDDCRPIPSQILTSAFDWYYSRQHEHGRRVLVSCAAGESRSVAMAIGLLLFEPELKAEPEVFLETAATVCRQIPRAYPHPETLVSIANHWQIWLDYSGLRTLYDGVLLPPPFPWGDEILSRALANQESNQK